MARYSRVTEQDVEALLVKGIKQLKGLCFKLKFLGISGAPDRLALLPGGRFYFVELKKSNGELEASQAILFPRIERLGFKVHTLYGEADVNVFISTLKEATCL
jgi:hypothetical protein